VVSSSNCQLRRFISSITGNLVKREVTSKLMRMLSGKTQTVLSVRTKPSEFFT